MNNLKILHQKLASDRLQSLEAGLIKALSDQAELKSEIEFIKKQMFVFNELLNKPENISVH